MRHWLFHPIIFYPLAILFAALVIVISLEPQSWPRDPAQTPGVQDGQWLVFQRESFNSPDAGGEEMTVVRDYWGRPLTLAYSPNKGAGPAAAGRKRHTPAADLRRRWRN